MSYLDVLSSLEYQVEYGVIIFLSHLIKRVLSKLISCSFRSSLAYSSVWHVVWCLSLCMHIYCEPLNYNQVFLRYSRMNLKSWFLGKWKSWINFRSFLPNTKLNFVSFIYLMEQPAKAWTILSTGWSTQHPLVPRIDSRTPFRSLDQLKILLEG